jgi:aspartyl-tRNA(Asn)/glutamyl-tRNA(Gln) amidotransferase subunit A
MSATSLTRLSLEEAGERIRRRELSPVELADAILTQIERLNPALNAFTTIVPREAVLAAARIAEREIAAGGWLGPLHGVPVSVKDLFDTAGLRTTYGSGMFRDHVPTADAAVAERLKAAGAVITGKTATHEFGKGLTTNNYFFGATRNPWNVEHIPGGSSGGAAAAAAACLGPLHVGSDGGGSIRFPAGWCGVTGLKPTLGLISNRGQMSSGQNSFSVPGPLTRGVRDAAIAAQALAGFDPGYIHSRPQPVPDLLRELEAGVRGLRVGVSLDLLEPAPTPDVRSAFDASVRRLEGLGAQIVELRMPHHELVLPGVMALFGIEGEVLLDGLLGDRPRVFSPEVERLNALWVEPSVVDAVRAQQNRQRVRRDYDEAFLRTDVIALPVAPVPAPAITTDPQTYVFHCPPYTGAANLAGLPAVPLPMGESGGLPLSLQILGPVGGDAVVLRVARALEAAAAEHRVRVPPVAA